MTGDVFDAYAAYYDLLNRDKDYAAEAAYVDALLRKQRPATLRLLELGCGTGAHAEELARLGYTVTGVDLSPEMVARARARQQGLPAEIAQRLEFLTGDAQTVRVGRVFDAVVSLFHVFSYQTSNAALQSVFQTSAAHLQRGGLLCFDYWYGPAVLTQRPEVRVRRMEDERYSVQRLAEPEMHPSANRVRVTTASTCATRPMTAAAASPRCTTCATCSFPRSSCWPAIPSQRVIIRLGGAHTFQAPMIGLLYASWSAADEIGRSAGERLLVRGWLPTGLECSARNPSPRFRPIRGRVLD
jgi:SAM-dependent methyltransferase